MWVQSFPETLSLLGMLNFSVLKIYLPFSVALKMYFSTEILKLCLQVQFLLLYVQIIALKCFQRYIAVLYISNEISFSMPDNTFDGQVTVYLSIKHLSYAPLSVDGRLSLAGNWFKPS